MPVDVTPTPSSKTSPAAVTAPTVTEPAVTPSVSKVTSPPDAVAPVTLMSRLDRTRTSEPTP